MKLKDLNNSNKLDEMTARVPPMDHIDIKHIENSLVWLKEHGKIVGYEGRKPILEYIDAKGITFCIINDDIITSVVNGTLITIQNKEYFELHVFYSLPKYRKIGDVARLLWFIKHQLKHSIIFYGWQSPDAIAFIDHVHKTNKFRMHWLNDQTGEEEPYDNNDKRTDNRINDWRLILEHDDWGKGNHLERWGGPGPLGTTNWSWDVIGSDNDLI